MGENQSSRSGASGPVVLSSKSFGAGKVSPACLKSATSEERAKAMPSMICSALLKSGRAFMGGMTYCTRQRTSSGQLVLNT